MEDEASDRSDDEVQRGRCWESEADHEWPGRCVNELFIDARDLLLFWSGGLRRNSIVSVGRLGTCLIRTVDLRAFSLSSKGRRERGYDVGRHEDSTEVSLGSAVDVVELGSSCSSPL